MKRFLQLAGILLLVWACQTVPDPAEKSYYISASQYDNAKHNEACSFRYKIDNSYRNLTSQLQQQAVRAAFDLWQNANPNILFLQKQDGLVTEINIGFGKLTEEDRKDHKATIGLLRGNLESLSKVLLKKNNTTILLDEDFAWDTHSITRVVAYHIGKFLGLSNSTETSSLLYPLYIDQSLRLTVNDSTELNRLYNVPCEGECRDFLPQTLKLHGMAARSIRIDQPGKITITGSGSLYTGPFLKWSTSDGLAKGLFNFSIDAYNLVPDYNHAALIYKLNNEPNWRLCKSKCEFETDGVSQCLDLTLAINDNDTLNNEGTYNVIVDYKK
ncbi:Matrixin [Dyadobacter sp. SG02]|uniref:matrixin family metalloprotease n=1 Tax=Dyadobacter sp. SG02 TaxID=1855291 RepID=UPI0008B082E9|nr:matrixin family metalloprotease [Dyadobacter sp. SG02]SEI49859.1 Matrixin [Dyadobacter sp. SG02]